MFFESRTAIAGFIFLSGIISGCAPYVCNPTQKLSSYEAQQVCGSSLNGCGLAATQSSVSPFKISASGYGAPGSYTQYTVPQQKLMAMRAAQVDAYRNLAEQVQGFRISGNTTVSAFTVQSDSIRTYVDSFIRGARVTSITSIADGNFQANVELDISDQFINCITKVSGCVTQNTHANCGAIGCSSPSSMYVSY